MDFDQISLPPPIDPPPLEGSFQLSHDDTDVPSYSHDVSIMDTQASSHILIEYEPSNHYVMFATDNSIVGFIKPM